MIVNVNENALDRIIKKSKTIEGRVFDGFFKKNYHKLQPDTQIIFTSRNTNKYIHCYIKRVTKYNSLNDYLDNENIKNIAPMEKCELIKHYKSLYQYKNRYKLPFIAIEISNF